MDFRTISGVLGTLTAFITFMSPAREVYKLWQQGRTTEQYFTAIPYHAATINCALWVIYGDLRRDMFLAIINKIGFFMAMTYLILFILLTRALVGVKKHAVIFLVQISSLLALSRLAMSFHDPATFSGIICATGSTICVVKMVYETKRVDHASFLESFASFANGVIWSIYGIISSDKFIWVPNLVWAFVGLAQITQFVIHHRSALLKK